MLSYNDTTEKPSPERSRAEASLVKWLLFIGPNSYSIVNIVYRIT